MIDPIFLCDDTPVDERREKLAREAVYAPTQLDEAYHPIRFECRIGRSFGYGNTKPLAFDAAYAAVVTGVSPKYAEDLAR